VLDESQPGRLDDAGAIVTVQIVSAGHSPQQTRIPIDDPLPGRLVAAGGGRDDVRIGSSGARMRG
jgi:hypothetical protein